MRWGKDIERGVREHRRQRGKCDIYAEGQEDR